MTWVVLLSLLVVPWCSGRLVCVFRPSFQAHLPFLGVAGVSLVFLFSATGHFVKTEGMTEMLPGWVPWRIAVVYLSGVFELACAIALLLPRICSITGWGVICYLLLVYPVNVHAAATGRGLGMPELGLWYLILRTPVQVVLITWTYWFVIRQAATPAGGESAGFRA